MAKIWPVYEGKDPTSGDPWADLPLDDAVRVLSLEPAHFRTGLSRTPRFGDATRDRRWAGYQHVVVEIGEEEAKADWRPGFYGSPLVPVEAFFRLQVHSRVGEQWRDEWKRDLDADGEPAIRVWFVLKADAPDSDWDWENRERIRAEVREAARESGVPEWVFIRFRKEKEEAPVS